MQTLRVSSILLVFLVATGCLQATPENTSNVNTANLNTSNVNEVKNTNTVANDNINTSENVNETVENSSGVTWIADPQQIDRRGLFGEEGEQYTYYKIADLSDGGEVIYVALSEMGTSVSRFRTDASGNYYLLTKHSDSNYSNPENEQVNTDRFSIDDTTEYKELTYPDTLQAGDITLVAENLPFDFNQLYSLSLESTDAINTLVASTEYGEVYEVQRNVETDIDNGSVEVKKYILKLADTTTITYLTKKDFLADDNTLTATLNEAGSAFETRVLFRGLIAGGCGVAGGEQYAKNITADELEEIGTTPSGEALYIISEPENSILKNAYEMYKLGRDYDGSSIELLTYDEFISEQPVMLWQDDAGDYMLYAYSEIAPLVECGKPVIYLYPTEPTNVTVQVGANITISEPTYGSGWNVLAQPNGQLTSSAGESAENLYWEGKGHGEYPKITTGKVVPRSLAVRVIRNDLATLGLTASEIHDFLDFWQERLPTTPYVRLSWLTTEQMNSLAPLRVSPQPDSVLRVFLDFSGQTSPFTNLQPQVLTSTDRHGFALVEWGGLLVGQK